LRPQQYAAPAGVSAQVCWNPAAMVPKTNPPETGNAFELHGLFSILEQRSLVAAPS